MKRLCMTLVAAVAALTAVAYPRLRYHDVVSVDNDTVAVAILPADAVTVSAECRATLRQNRRLFGARQPVWGLRVGDVSVILDCLADPGGYPTDSPSASVTLMQGDSVVETLQLDGRFESQPGLFNTLSLTIDRLGGEVTVGGGADMPSPLMRHKLIIRNDDFHACLFSDGRLEVLTLLTESDGCLPGAGEMRDPSDVIARIAASSDPMEALWQPLDHSNDPDYGRLGGDYMLATLSDGHGGYDIVYLGGAGVYRQYWKPGMLKGRLSKTIFIDSYTLWWLDATFEPVARDAFARVEQDAILTLDFPHYKTSMRFSRVPRNKTYLPDADLHR